jgi:hypothetical protein
VCDNRELIIIIIMTIVAIKDGLSMEHASLGPGIGLAQILGNNSQEAPLHCGSYRMEAGAEAVIDYPATLFNITLDGEFTVENNSKPGEVYHLKKNDIFRAEKGDSVKWSSSTGGHAFYVIQLPGGVDPTPYFNA